jgi:hypothetical protein
MASDALPVYDASVPAQAQDADYDCSQESAQWMLRAWGRSPDDGWMTQSLIDNGVMTPQLGLMDASGAGMAGWLNQEYGEFGYLASNEASVDFDDVADEAAELAHPLMIGGRAWCHWVGVRWYDAGRDVLEIANSAGGYMGVGQTLSRGQWASLGAFSMVRLAHPAAEGLADILPPPGLDYSWWEQDGKVGSGLLAMMAEDATLPAQDWSTWLPLGRNPAQIEECVGQSGTVYRWLLATNTGHRYRPS